MDLSYVLIFSSVASPLFILVAWLAGKKNTRLGHDIALLGLISLAFDLLAVGMAFSQMNNHLVGSSFMLFQTLAIAYIVHRHGKSNSKLLLASIILNTAILFLDGSFISGFERFAPYASVAHFITIVAWMTIYFKSLLDELPSESLYEVPLFWVCTGALLFYSGNLFNFIFANLFMEGELAYNTKAWILHLVLNITKNIIFAVALWKTNRK